jgi:hypothetical protein
VATGRAIFRTPSENKRLSAIGVKREMAKGVKKPYSGNKGHVGFSGDGDPVALEGRRARTKAARAARTLQRHIQSQQAAIPSSSASDKQPLTLEALALRLSR